MTTRSITALFGALLLGVGAFCTLMVVFQDKNIIEKLEYVEYYQAIAGVANALAIMMLIYLTISGAPRSEFVKWITVIILIVGYVVEIYFTFIFTDKSYESVAFSIIAANLLFRGYFMMQYMQEPWDMPTFQGVTKALAAPAIAESSGPTPSDTAAYRNSFKEILNQARSQREDGALDKTSLDKAWNVINKAISENSMTKDKLREASSQLKFASDQSGINVSSLTFGGRKRR